MNNPPQIRPATLNDIPAIQQLLRHVWLETYADALGEAKVLELSEIWHNSERLKLDIGQDNIIFLIAEQDAKLLATASLTRKNNQEGALLSAVIGRMYVHPAAQKQGLGEALLKALITPLEEGTRLSLTVEPQNQGAISFYQRHGFEIAGPGSCSEDPHDDVPTLIMTAVKHKDMTVN